MFICVNWSCLKVPFESKPFSVHPFAKPANFCRCLCRNQPKHVLQVLMQSSESDSQSSFRVAVTKPQRRRPEKEMRSEQMQPTMDPSGNWKPNPVLVVAATIALAAAGGYLGLKKLLKRRDSLIERCGMEMVRYGSTELELVDIAEEYKSKWELIFSRVDLYENFLVTLLKERALSFQLIEDSYTVYKTLGLSHKQLLMAYNRAAKRLRERPSALDKLLFVSERLLPEQFQSKLEIMQLFPYPKETVRDLQRSLAETCFLQLLKSEGRDKDFSPIEKARFLGLSEEQAQSLYDQYLLEEVQRRDYERATSEKKASVEETSTSTFSEQSVSCSKPSASVAHAYQCQNCGYTIFPAAGREFKFFGDSFVCPQCKSPKSQFVDISNEDEDE
ncbi:hypothetical protein Gasu2_26270 [Galdieria sulphuraria]|uniref:Rubredoxin-like domain-containing protein n=1 Tax=Galdieria sulphuraria TaxID=130081 RepID=M2XZD0_GALSU|nr:uncharacterized protein Gasu_36650 [Galdieria sulphuraria]EME28929.1 hypothetical protein Gasu_36650 [Galdieria sulphuraria]GJD08317.1 hypothetical protein Gasu2_26270 [Galdieria sulphuraria]|eukprot:XP_005705449.1 hypothetical protein Gasu_36650 [Galdieria sulphuraria]